MNAYQDRVSAVLKQYPTIIFISLLGLLLGGGLSFLRPLEYSSRSGLLIRENLEVAVDAYTASRSAERVADDLASGIYTSTFFEQVLKTGTVIDQNYFPKDDLKRRKKWGKTVATSVGRGSGSLSITVYHPQVDQAKAIAEAVSAVLISSGSNYTSGTNIDVRVVDAPLNSRYPVRPNIPLNAFSGLILGAVGGVGLAIIQSERRTKRTS